MKASEKLEAIERALDSGRTIYVSTYTNHTKITPKSAAKWADAGMDLFKVSGNSLYMAAGKRFDCIDYCKISVK